MFAVFQNTYVFNPLSLSVPLTVCCGSLRFRGTLFEKQWPKGRKTVIPRNATERYPGLLSPTSENRHVLIYNPLFVILPHSQSYK